MEPLNVVIIEDEKAHFELMKRAIDNEFPLALVHYFEEAGPCLERLDEIIPDVIITDYLMAGMNGIEFLEALNRQNKDIPVIMITGQGNENIAVQAMKLGAWDYLVKTPDFFALLPSVIQNVARERKLKEALRASERRFRDLAERTSDWIWEINTQGSYTYANPIVENVLGYCPDEVTGKHFHDFFSKQGKEILKHNFFQTIAERKPISAFESRLIHKDGREVIVETNGVPFFDKAGRLLGYRGIHRDISERKRAERALRESEEKYRSIFESIQDVYYEVTLDGIILEVSPSIEEVSRYKREEVIGKSLYDIYADPKKRDEFVKEILRDGKVTDYEILLKDKDGSQHYCSITAKLVSDEHGNPVKIIGSGHNITKRKKAEDSLRESEEKYRNLFENAPLGLGIADEDGYIIAFNDAMLGPGGYRQEDIARIRRINELYYIPEERDKILSTARQQGFINETQVQFKRKDGTPYDALLSLRPIKVKGKPCWQAMIQDVTQRKRTQKALQESEAQKRAILDASIDRIRYVDKDMRIIWANKTTAIDLDMSPEDLVGRVCFELFLGRDIPCEGCPTVRAGETGQIERAVMHKSKANGIEKESYWDNYSVPLKNKAGDIEGFIQIARNITDQMRAEERIHTLSQELIRAQESERRMISCELHDRVGQDLSTLKISCETLFDDQPGLPIEIRHGVLELCKGLKEVISTVRDLAYDLRPSSLDQLGLVQTVYQYCEDFSEQNGLSVDFFSAGMDDLRLDFDTEINIYRLIQEGLNNIKKHADASRVIIRLVASSPNIILRIEDDGKGFDVEGRLPRASKEKRMGLASMEERVSLLNGNLRIQSRLMEGTKILVEIPYKEQRSDHKKKRIDH